MSNIEYGSKSLLIFVGAFAQLVIHCHNMQMSATNSLTVSLLGSPHRHT